jgi:hypothetical protein
MSVEDRQKKHEQEIDRLIAGLAGQGQESDWALARALVHRAVHLVADRKAGEFCAVATFLAEMVGHAHAVMHPDDDQDSSHQGGVH